MEIGKIVLFAGLCLLIGFAVSIFSGIMNCGFSKVSFLTSLKEGAIWAGYPGGVYLVSLLMNKFAPSFRPIQATLEGIGALKDRIDGTTYIMILASWVGTVAAIARTEQAVCKPSAAEMTKFKKELLAELHEKEKATEANAPLK